MTKADAQVPGESQHIPGGALPEVPAKCRLCPGVEVTGNADRVCAPGNQFNK